MFVALVACFFKAKHLRFFLPITDFFIQISRTQHAIQVKTIKVTITVEDETRRNRRTGGKCVQMFSRGASKEDTT